MHERETDKGWEGQGEGLCLCIQMTALKLKTGGQDYTQEELVMSALDFSQIAKCNKNSKQEMAIRASHTHTQP